MSRDQETVLRLQVPACPQGVVAIRQTLAGLCEAVAPVRADDVRVAASEACENAVRFARLNPLADQDLDIEARLSTDALVLIVRGAGAGMPTGPVPRQLRASLMGAVADQLTVVPRSGKQGTETRLTFQLELGTPRR